MLPVVVEEIKVVRRLESGGSALIKAEEPERALRSPSPARNPVSRIIHVRNLTRPFTLNQLKELLGRTGTISNEDFWIDKIKSHCFAIVSILGLFCTSFYRELILVFLD